VTGETEASYHGHGPAFAAVCNRIGAALGLPPVRSAKKRGKDRDLPSCAQWPHNVRPPEYYQGAFWPPAEGDDQGEGDGEPEAAPLEDRLCRSCRAVEDVYQHLIGYKGLMSPLPKGRDGCPTEATYREWLRAELTQLEERRLTLGWPANDARIDPAGLTVTFSEATPFGPNSTAGEAEQSLRTCSQLYVELRVGIRGPASGEDPPAAPKKPRAARAKKPKRPR
jgi:hypothetical protein